MSTTPDVNEGCATDWTAGQFGELEQRIADRLNVRVFRKAKKAVGFGAVGPRLSDDLRIHRTREIGSIRPGLEKAGGLIVATDLVREVIPWLVLEWLLVATVNLSFVAIQNCTVLACR